MDDKIEMWEDNIKPVEGSEIITNPNEIDMECDFCDDDDGFGISSESVVNQTVTSDLPDNSTEMQDGRCLSKKTGIILNFNDDDITSTVESRPLIVQNEQDILNAKNNTLTDVGLSRDDFSGVNDIDMECNCCEDDFEDNHTPSNKDVLDFSEDDPDLLFTSKELVDESVKEQKKLLDQGDVEKDYWDNLQKKHAKTNVKGSYNTHFHFAGNPKVEMADFNHDMGMITADGGVGNITSSCEGGLGEQKENNKYQKLFEELLIVTGFDIHKDNEGNIVLSDRCNYTQPISCKNTEDVFISLKPYIEDSYIYPLQYETNEKFNDCADWCNWYTEEMRAKYPHLVNDINICELIANHRNEVKF